MKIVVKIDSCNGENISLDCKCRGYTLRYDPTGVITRLGLDNPAGVKLDDNPAGVKSDDNPTDVKPDGKLDHKPTDIHKPAHNHKPADSHNPADTHNPADSHNPVDSHNLADRVAWG